MRSRLIGEYIQYLSNTVVTHAMDGQWMGTGWKPTAHPYSPPGTPTGDALWAVWVGSGYPTLACGPVIMWPFHNWQCNSTSPGRQLIWVCPGSVIEIMTCVIEIMTSIEAAQFEKTILKDRIDKPEPGISWIICTFRAMRIAWNTKITWENHGSARPAKQHFNIQPNLFKMPTPLYNDHPEETENGFYQQVSPQYVLLKYRFDWIDKSILIRPTFGDHLMCETSLLRKLVF